MVFPPAKRAEKPKKFGSRYMPAQENVITKTFDFIVYLIPVLEKFPRSQKYLVTDKLEMGAIKVLENLITAYYAEKKNKPELLRATNVELEKMRYMVRICHTLKYIDHHRYGVMSEKINEIGKMVGGWLKAVV